MENESRQGDFVNCNDKIPRDCANKFIEIHKDITEIKQDVKLLLGTRRTFSKWVYDISKGVVLLAIGYLFAMWKADK